MKKSGFTLLELLIVLMITGMIVLAVSQGSRNAIKYLSTGKDATNRDKTVGLLFNQLERDFSSAFKGTAYEYNKKENTYTQKDIKNFFVGRFKSDMAARVDGKKKELFESLSFLATDPIQIYGKGKKRYVRVKYELKLNKAQSKGDKLSYDLIRKESSVLKDFSLKESNEDLRGKLKTYQVAENIQALYLEYGKIVKKKDEKEPHLQYKFSWEEDNMPEIIKVHLALWNTDKEKVYNFIISIPIFSVSMSNITDKDLKVRDEKK